MNHHGNKKQINYYDDHENEQKTRTHRYNRVPGDGNQLQKKSTS